MEPRWTLKAWDDLTRDELYDILAARQDIFIVEQTCPYRDADGADARALHLWAHSDAGILAYLRVFPPGDAGTVEARLGRVLTMPAGRGRGLGREVMRRGLEVVRERFAGAPVRIGAQKYLLRFYSELGFVSTGHEYLEDGIPHVEMLRG